MGQQKFRAPASSESDVFRWESAVRGFYISILECLEDLILLDFWSSFTSICNPTEGMARISGPWDVAKYLCLTLLFCKHLIIYLYRVPYTHPTLFFLWGFSIVFGLIFFLSTRYGRPIWRFTDLQFLSIVWPAGQVYLYSASRLYYQRAGLKISPSQWTTDLSCGWNCGLRNDSLIRQSLSILKNPNPFLSRISIEIEITWFRITRSYHLSYHHRLENFRQ